jgi:hypothetical protein
MEKRIWTYDEIVAWTEMLNLNPTKGNTFSLKSWGVDGKVYDIEIYYSIWSLKWFYRVVEA